MGKNRYDPEQWEFMNRPETQERIRQSLKGHLRSFLDTAPDGRTQERFLEVLSLLKTYFKKELDESPTEYTEFVLANLSAAIRGIPTEERLRQVMDAPRRPVSIEEWERFEKFLEREGLEGWWD
jgi:hypothetical protein